MFVKAAMVLHDSHISSFVNSLFFLYSVTKISLPVAYGSSSQFKKETEIFGYNRKKLLVMATRMLGDVEQAGWKRVALFRTDSFDLLLLSLILAPILLSSRLFQE